jgi:hypothetical protein
MRRRTGVTALVLLLCAGTAGCGAIGGSAAPAAVTVTVKETVTVTQAAPATEPPAPDTSAEDASTADLPTSDASSGEPDPTGEADITGLESEGAAVDPCTLVTRADAETLAATKLDPATKINQTCTYNGPVTGPTAQVQVFVGPGSKKQLDIEKELGHPLRKLTGVGDEAYAAEASVFIRKGTLWASVELVRLNEPAENVDRLAQVAKTVAGRL